MEKAIDKYAESAIAKTASLMMDANLQVDVSQTLLRQALWREALRRTGGNKSRAASLLGVHRNTFSRGCSPDMNIKLVASKKD